MNFWPYLAECPFFFFFESLSCDCVRNEHYKMLSQVQLLPRVLDTYVDCISRFLFTTYRNYGGALQKPLSTVGDWFIIPLSILIQGLILYTYLLCVGITSPRRETKRYQLPCLLEKRTPRKLDKNLLSKLGSLVSVDPRAEVKLWVFFGLLEVWELVPPAQQKTGMRELFERAPELESLCLVATRGLVRHVELPHSCPYRPLLTRLGACSELDLFCCLNKTNSSLFFLRWTKYLILENTVNLV